MKSIDNFFQHRRKQEEISLKETQYKTERAELTNKILIRLNKEREGTKWKPLSPIALAIKLKGIPTKRLIGFIKQCEQAKSFGACFFGTLKKK